MGVFVIEKLNEKMHKQTQTTDEFRYSLFLAPSSSSSSSFSSSSV